MCVRTLRNTCSTLMGETNLETKWEGNFDEKDS
jgi:hypothetical protein